MYILYTRCYKWLCYAACNAGFCTLFMPHCHTCTNCTLKAKSCSKCRFCRAWLSAELLFQVLGAVSSFASAKCCPSRLGRYLVPISARKMFPVFCQIVSLCCWDTYKMCAKIWGLEQKIFVLVSHKIGWSMARIHGQYRWRKRRIIIILIRESVC